MEASRGGGGILWKENLEQEGGEKEKPQKGGKPAK
jgi:hypothetical protein